VILFAVLVIALSSWWYIGKLIETGVLTGSHDIAMLQRSGGLLQALPHFKNPIPILRIAQNVVNSFLWIGTWSFVLPPLISIIPPLLLAAMLMAAYLAQIAKGNVRGADWIAPCSLGIFVLGIIYQSFAQIMVYGNAGFHIWYVHAYVALLAPMVAIALALLMSVRYLRLVTASLLIYPLIILPLGMATLLLFYAGIGMKREGTSYLDFSSLSLYAKNASTVYANLSVLSEPTLFAVCFISGWLLAAFGFFCSIRLLWTKAPGGHGFTCQTEGLPLEPGVNAAMSAVALCHE